MKKLSIMLLLPVLFIYGCTSSEQYTAGGALAGGAAGAIIGNQHRNRGLTGALVGATVGALAGTAIGQSKEVDKLKAAQQTIVICPTCNTRVDVTGFPPHSVVECPKCRSQFTY